MARAPRDHHGALRTYVFRTNGEHAQLCEAHGDVYGDLAVVQADPAAGGIPLQTPARRDLSEAPTGSSRVATPGGPATLEEFAARGQAAQAVVDAVLARHAVVSSPAEHTAGVLAELASAGSEAWRYEVHAHLVGFAAQVLTALDHHTHDPDTVVEQVSAAAHELKVLLGWTR